MTETAKRIVVFGRVQGVAYRAWAVDTARSLGVAGWVRNRMDGSVEALLVGSAQGVGSMIEACRRGPRAARVDRMEVRDARSEAADISDFHQLPTV